MIAITFALPAESSGLIRRLAGSRRMIRGGVKIVAGRLSGRDIEVLHTGVGGKVCGARLMQYLDTSSPVLLISSGFAGATRSNLRVGDLVLAQNFSDAVLVAGARRALREQNVHAGKLFTASVMVDSLEEREEIWRRHEAVAIDMETEVIARICADRQLRMLSIRVLSDTPRHPFPLPSDILFDVPRQRTPAVRLLRYLMAHPGAIPRLVKFSRKIGQARGALTEALVKVVQKEL